MKTTSEFRNLSVTAAAALSRDAYAMSHALLLRSSNHIYAAAALSQSKVHDADRPSPSAALAVVQPAMNYLRLVHMQRTVKCSELRREGGREQHDKPIDGSRGEAPMCAVTGQLAD